MSRRIFLDKILRSLGAGVVSRLLNSELLYAYTYHRVHPQGKKQETLFDDGVYGPTQDQLKQQLLFLKENTTLLSENDLISAYNGKNIGKGPFSRITFDDAYKDNYDLVMPLLFELKIPAIYFVPTLLVEERMLGWWDQIAYIIKNTKKEAIEFWQETIPLSNNKPEVINLICGLMKLAPHEQTANLLTELAEVADSPLPSRELMDKELMTWEQLKEAHDAGITLGAHSCRHLVLATLSKVEQQREIVGSKDFIYKKLKVKPRSFAYPVGGQMHFNETTTQLVEHAGYDLAFSNDTRLENLCQPSRFAIPRQGALSDIDKFKTFNFPHLGRLKALNKNKLLKTINKMLERKACAK